MSSPAWIFDLDNTLYDGDSGFWPQIDQTIRKAVRHFLHLDEQQAYVIQKQYAQKYGTTLAGMVREHQTDPKAFLAIAHDIDYSVIPKNPALDQALRQLPGQKYIYTNADKTHVDAVLGHLGLTDIFTDIVDFLMLGGRVKPDPDAFSDMMAYFKVDPAEQLVVFFDDLPRNLVPAKQQGVVSVLVNQGPDSSQIDDTPSQADYETDNLATFLASLPKPLHARAFAA